MTRINERPISTSPRILASMAMLAVLSNAPAMSGEYDKFELSAGGYAVFRYDSNVSLTETNVGVGISFSPRDTLGLEGEQTVLRLDGRYRFKPNHAITFTWFRLNSASNKTLLDDIESSTTGIGEIR